MESSKVRKVDFTATDWLAGTVRLTNAQRGVYITACALIYDFGGPVARSVIADWCRGLPRATGALIDRLIAAGKLVERDGLIDNPRCEKEIQAARRRIDAWSENGSMGGRPPRQNRVNSESKASQSSALSDSIVPGKAAETNDIKKPRGSDSPLPITTHQVEVGDSQRKAEPRPEEVFKKGEKGLGRCAPEVDTTTANAAGPVAVAAVGVVEQGGEDRKRQALSSLPALSAASNVRRPTEKEIAAVDELVEQTREALSGHSGTAEIRDPAARQAAIKDRKFNNLVITLNRWASERLDGNARLAAWEVLAAAERAGSGAAMVPGEQRAFDQLAELYRASQRVRVAA